MQHAPFVHLHLHTYYSLLDGAIPIDALAACAKELRMPAIAMTDHGNLFGAIEFYEIIQKYGIKPLIGCEVYLLSKGSHKDRQSRQETALTHLTLLCKNRIGYKNLCRLISASYLEGFYYKPRIDKALLRDNNEGLIALSGCLKGEISQALVGDRLEEAQLAAREYASIFTNNRFYLELQDQGLPDQKKLKSGLINLAKEFGLPIVATNDVHFLKKEDASVQDALLCIQTGTTIAAKDRLRLESDEFYLKSAEEMTKLFSDCPEAISNTVAIAERLNLDFDFNNYHFPKFVPPEEKDLAQYLDEKARLGLEERWPAIKSAYKTTITDLRNNYEKRLLEELAIIKSMGFAGYFLIVADFIGFAKSKGIPVGPGRGSAAGSLVAYCLKITDIDPIVHGLLFERFLNPERISMPDMDIDFCMRRRDEVIRYVAEKYGNVSQIITFGKMKARAVVRDVGRVMGLAYGDVDRIAKLIPATLNMTLDQALEIEPKLKEATKTSPDVKRLIEIARSLEGFPRHASTHAAGVVISDQPLTEFLPLYLGQHDEIVTQYDMKAVEKAGLVKFDFLGLKTLTVIDDAIRLIQKRHGLQLKMDELPLDDGLVFTKLSEGDTAGVFQLESSGMTALVTRLKPTAFADIVALVALFRPGPLGSGMVDDFIDRKHGRTQNRYELPQMEPILKDTYGVIVYQEQVMRIANELAGFTLGDADILRRAMGKKRPEEMAKQKERFIIGCTANKISKAKAERIFDLMAKFAEYGFNKSHSAAYAMVSYQTAYLKAHFPTEFMAALLTSEKDNTDKILQYIGDCKSHSIKILPPDVNESDLDFSVVDDSVIRFGLAAVKNVGEASIDCIISARGSAGPFTSLFDFCERVDARRANKRVLESLIKCGAFDFTKKPRAAMFEALDQAMEQAASHQRDRLSGQSRIFDLINDVQATPAAFPDVPEWPERQLLAFEKETLGFYITGHPLAQYESLLRQYATIDTAGLAEAKDKQEVRLGGVCAKLKEITTKRGDRMGFVTLEDLKGSAEVIVFSDLYSASHLLIKGEKPFFVIGQADTDGETVKIIARQIMPVEEVPEQLTKSVHFILHAPEITPRHLQQLKSVLARFTGNCPGFVHLVSPNKTETVLALPDNLKLSPTSQLVTSVEKLFGHNVTRFQS